MTTVIGIPARMGASRFPGKPLCSILGVPMIEHVYRRCTLVKNQDLVFVAACDREIQEKVESLGGKVIMTNPNIERPALRVAEAAKTLELRDDDMIVVVQGDEPLVNPGMLELGIQALKDHPEAICTNLCAEISDTEMNDPNEIKVVSDIHGNALYMSRNPIPSHTRKERGPVSRQLGIFFFWKKSLMEFQALSSTPLEKAESIEMLRAIEHGRKVLMVKSPYISKAVDTETDRQEAERLMKDDPVWKDYSALSH